MKEDCRFSREETQYIIKRFNNDFISKCLAVQKFQEFDNGIQTCSQEMAADKKTDYVKKAYNMCCFYFRTELFLYRVKSCDSGLELLKKNTGNGNITKAVISWKLLAKQIDGYIKKDIFFSRQQDRYKFTALLLYDTLQGNGGVKSSISIDENDALEDIKCYFLKIISFVKKSQSLTEMIRSHHCSNAEDLKNRILLDVKFRNELKLEVLSEFNKSVINGQPESIINSSLTVLFTLCNIDRIKEALRLDCSIGSKIYDHEDMKEYEVCDAKNGLVRLQNGIDYKDITFHKLNEMCHNIVNKADSTAGYSVFQNRKNRESYEEIMR